MLTWILLNSKLNSFNVIQRKVPRLKILPLVCFLCFKASEELNHLFFECAYSLACWSHLFAKFDLSWVFSNDSKCNLLHIFVGSNLPSRPQLLWSNGVKAIDSEIWFEWNPSAGYLFKLTCFYISCLIFFVSSLWELYLKHFFHHINEKLCLLFKKKTKCL